MSTIMKLLEEDMYQELFLWILNLVPWIPLELVLSVNYSDLIISSLDKPELEIIGLKVIILKVLNLLIQFLMLLEKKLKVVIVYKDSKSLTL